ncbi:YgaP family membrane protein [Thiocystis violascens]|uniref:Inner membrane protein YgaP-like transmembrane domain-containing protein n=1 Tax=Thiocystis violascens (strain ATCC 17096 / DSM 198 / 6111) TaxID=765911 RepID=I3Y6Y9_THIV6|nr:DUF2892 domain-containing protein [Thiocystis violascens]AFL72757.1 Protein of unknown function (DUF2892) [Thiocystis violascens DSM 198]
MNMPKNIGDTDRNIRFIAGGAVVLLGLIYTWWLILIGLILIGTAYLRSCPAYTLIGMDTNKK